MDILYNILQRLPGAVVAITLHEFLKAWLSVRYGDPIPKREGRITLNPLKHIDPIGFILFLVCGYGWTRPVNTTALYYKQKRRDTLVTYILPTLANFVLSVAVLVIYVLITRESGEPAETDSFYILYKVVYSVAFCNFTLAIINFIPIYPMDGAKVLSTFLKPKSVVSYAKYENVLKIVFVFFILIGIASFVFDRIFYAMHGFIINLIG